MLALVVGQVIALGAGYINATPPRSVLIVYFGQVGMVPLLVIAFTFSLYSRNNLGRPDKRLSRTAYVTAVFGLIFTGLAALLGLVLGQDFWDIVGSSARMSVIFLVVGAGMIALNSVGDSDIEYRLRIFAWTILVASIIGGLGKATLLAQGRTYGAGLNQYYMGTFALVLAVLVLATQRQSHLKRLLIIGALLLGMSLSVLSFKRGVWFEMVAAFGAVLVIAYWLRRSRGILLLAIVGVGVSFVVVAAGYADRLYRRYTYSLDDTGSVVLQGNVRWEEMVGAGYTLNLPGNRLGWLVGLGPGAGYRHPSGFPFRNVNEAGDPFHIHSFYGIVGFRYGLIGLVLYMVLVSLSFVALYRVVRAVRRSAMLPDLTALIAISSSLAVMASLVAGLFANELYGSFELAFLLTMSVVASETSTRKLGKSPSRSLDCSSYAVAKSGLGRTWDPVSRP